jgi:hypothetical protein
VTKRKEISVKIGRNNKQKGGQNPLIPTPISVDDSFVYDCGKSLILNSE